jgi:hypothetical protein
MCQRDAHRVDSGCVQRRRLTGTACLCLFPPRAIVAGSDYAEYLSRVSSHKAAAAASTESVGIKLTRRQRLEKEAAVVEQQALDKLDFERQKYLQMLGAAVRVGPHPGGACLERLFQWARPHQVQTGGARTALHQEHRACVARCRFCVVQQKGQKSDSDDDDSESSDDASEVEAIRAQNGECQGGMRLV